MELKYSVCPAFYQPVARYGDEPLEVVQNYNLVFEDHFDQAPGSLPDASKWGSAYPWGSDLVINGEEQHYTDVLAGDTRAPNPFDFDGNSNLIIQAGINSPEQESATGQKYYSGVLTGWENNPIKYGYIETRLKLPKDNIGMWAAFWLLNRYYVPDPGATGPNGKRETEMDWEFVRGPGGYFGGGPYTSNRAYGAYHYDGGQWKIDANGFSGRNPATGDYDQPGYTTQCDGTPIQYGASPPAGFDPVYSAVDLADDFHTFGFLWTEDSIRYYMDGIERFSVCDAAIVSQVDMYVILNLAVGGAFPGPAVESDYVGGVQMLVDYVRIFQA